MATVLLAAAGGVAGKAAAGALGASALTGTFLGISASSLVSGLAAGAGQAIGGFVGSRIDAALFGPGDQRIAGQQLQSVRPLGTAEGTPLPVIYGQTKVTGRPVWSSRPLRVVETEKVKQGGSEQSSTTIENNIYYRSWAVKLARRPDGAARAIDGIGRVWANGTLVDISEWNTRLYLGEDGQEPDPLIVATEGWAPAWKRDAYLVIESLELTEFGNRPPALEIEVYRAVIRPNSLGDLARAIQIIPSSDEHIYDPEPVIDAAQEGQKIPINRRGQRGASDWEASIDRLQMVAPKIEQAAIVSAWFGDDLRCGSCKVEPRVDSHEKQTQPYAWSVSGLARADALLTSRDEAGTPLYGGTPADRSVIRGLRDLKARGLRASLHPFLLMDIPADNALPDPYGGDAQPPFPWRGRITSENNGTAAVAADVAAFFGTATAAHFSIGADDTVSYSGPAEWSFRRFILHHAFLAKASGGVDLFVIGSEMRGLTHLRDDAGAYPAVAALGSLLDEVAGIGGVADRITYNSDWSEFSPHQDGDDLVFHLDPLWANPNCAGPAISAYWPLTDHREGDDLWALRDLGALKGAVEGGEGYDWFYASAEDRSARTRTPITDGAEGEPWVYRDKDVRAWWANEHHDRIGGVRQAAPTGWAPKSKPIILFEVGCPAVDRGANQPNVFFDPKSSESFLPYFSTGARDDDMQRRYLTALLQYWNENNETSAGGVPLIDHSRTHLWCWDARPYPEFPARRDVWGDYANWRLGHWLTGRLGKIEVAAILAEIAAKRGWTLDAERLIGEIDGVIRDGTQSDRAFLTPLLDLVQADVFLDGTVLWAGSRALAETVDLDTDRMIPNARGENPIETTDADDLDIPRRVRVQYYEAGSDYRRAVAEPQKFTGSGGDAVLDIAVDATLSAEEAEARTASIMAERRRSRIADAFRVPPGVLDLRPGRAVRFAYAGRTIEGRALSVSCEWAREVAAERLDRDAYLLGAGLPDGDLASLPSTAAEADPMLVVMDLPRLDGAFVEHAPYFAAYASPWASVDIWRGIDADALERDRVISAPAVIGRLAAPLPAGPAHRWDRTNVLSVKLLAGGLASASERAVLDGANAVAVETDSGEWEVLSFVTATLVAPHAYDCRQLLRGLLGTEPFMGASEGARVVVLSGALRQPGYPIEARTEAFLYRFGPANRNVGSEAYEQFSAAYRGVGLRPWPPAHLRVSAAGGDLTATWVRRARWGGDDWNQPEVETPDPRRYAVRWKAAGGAILKAETIEDAEAATITAAEGAASAATIEVAHIGDRWGEGPAATAAI